jgi:CyaY protein
MSEAEFLAQFEAALNCIEDALDGCGVDVETMRTGPVLQLAFDDGSKIIINAQTPMRELWVAARAGGYHFRFDGGRWQDTRGAGELFERLSGWVSEQSGEVVELRVS